MLMERMVSFFFRAAPLSAVFRPTNLLHSLPYQTFNSSIIPSKPTSIRLQTPLFLQPTAHTASIEDLQKWNLWAKALATSVGKNFLDLDNGPDSTLLHRELNWLIQDSVEVPTATAVASPPMLAHLDGPSSAAVVKLRASLDDLYELWKQRIEERRPFQYLVGCEHWRDLVLSVQEGVLIPRPETELIVDFVCDVVSENERLREGLWADLGTGSGALAIGIGRILGSSGRVIATDLSPVAVSVASYNVQRYCLQDKVEVKQGSWFEPLKENEGTLAGLVCNPPYIPSENIAGLQAEVSKHEPILALDGGANGMSDLLHLCSGAASMLRHGGFFAFETNGEQQSKFLADYMGSESKGSLVDIKIRSDFAGIPRFVTGYKAR